MTIGGVAAPTYPADPFLACFRSPAERALLVAELEQVGAAGQDVKYEMLSGAEARVAEPALSSEVDSAVRLHAQRYLNPPAFLATLATAVRERGADILEGTPVTGIGDRSDGVVVNPGPDGVAERFDSVVLAGGAWLGDLARPFGVRQPVQAGRGYSFSVACHRVPQGPVYFPAQRVACTPLETPHGPRLRVAVMMELRPPDTELDERRIAAIVAAAVLIRALVFRVNPGCERW